MGKYHCTIDLLFYWLGSVCYANKNKNVSCHTADSKPVKQEVNGTVILPPLVFPVTTFASVVTAAATLMFSVSVTSVENYAHETSGLYYKSFTIVNYASVWSVTYDRNGKESTANRALGGSTYPG